MGRVSGSRQGRFTPTFNIHFSGRWMGPRTCLDACDRRIFYSAGDRSPILQSPNPLSRHYISKKDFILNLFFLLFFFSSSFSLYFTFALFPFFFNWRNTKSNVRMSKKMEEREETTDSNGWMISHFCVTFQVLTAVTMKIAVFCGTTL
jgi:hypothetical protein